MIQLISKNEKEIINLESASIVSNTETSISILVTKKGNVRDIESFLERGLFVSIHSDQNSIETVGFFVRSSVIDGGGEAGLLGTQIIIDFNVANTTT